MNFKIRLLYFFVAAAVCAVSFSVIGMLVLGLGSQKSYTSDADVYVALPPNNGRLLIDITEHGTVIGSVGLYLDCKTNKIYVSCWSASNNETAKTEGCRYISVPYDIFCEFIDKSNGALYTESGNTFVVMGQDIISYIKSGDDSAVAEIIASFLKKMLSPDNISSLEENLIELIDNSQGNMSFVQWVKYKKVLESIGCYESVISIGTSEFNKLFIKE